MNISNKLIPLTADMQYLATHGIHQLDETVTKKLDEKVTLGDLGLGNLAERLAELPFAAVDDALAKVEALQREHGADALLCNLVAPQNPDHNWLRDHTIALHSIAGSLQSLAARLKPFRAKGKTS